MKTNDSVPKTYPLAVRKLAEWHASGVSNGLEIYSFPDPDQKTVRLIEISDEFAGTGVVEPVTMGSSSDFPFKSSVALVTPSEWDRIQHGKIALPDGWELRTGERVWPRAKVRRK